MASYVTTIVFTVHVRVCGLILRDAESLTAMVTAQHFLVLLPVSVVTGGMRIGKTSSGRKPISGTDGVEILTWAIAQGEKASRSLVIASDALLQYSRLLLLATCSMFTGSVNSWGAR